MRLLKQWMPLLATMTISMAMAVAGEAPKPSAGDAPKPPPPPPKPATAWVANGFTVTTFADAPAVDTPSAIAVTPTGEVFLAEDEENVRGHKSGNGKIKLLLDPNNTGKADKITVWADKVNGPRGMCYVDGTLYVVAAPYLMAMRDNGSGVADKPDILINGFAPEPEKLAPDHSINGVRMAIDGWLYIACGDQAIPGGTAKDGSKLDLYGGGIARIRPDGTELELYCAGIRNCYDVGIDPLLNAFARDNTNDGDGWDVRFHHLVQSAEYGYPNLYKNYADEEVTPIADYGGGSGTGSLWIHEPGMPAGYGDNFFTCDWGRSVIYRHTFTANGATFKVQQDEWLKSKAPMDLDVDGSGRIFVADWGGKYFGKPNTPSGAVFRVVAAGAPAPAPWPDFAKLGEAELLAQLVSESAVHRLHAQRALLRRPGAGTPAALEKIVAADGPMYARVAAMFTLAQLQGAKSHAALLRFVADDKLREFALRALTDRKSQLAGLSPEPFVKALGDANPRVRMQAIISLGRLGATKAAPALLPLALDPDLMVRHIAMRGLRIFAASDVCIDNLNKDKPEQNDVLLRTLRDIHEPQAVDGLIARLKTEKDPALHRGLVMTIARLYYVKGPPTGWWGIRPDFRGPYFNPVVWSESPKIGKLLLGLLTGTDPDDQRLALEAIGKFRISGDEVSTALSKLAAASGPMQVDALKAMLVNKDLGKDALANLERMILDPNLGVPVRAEVIHAYEVVKDKDRAAALLRLADKLTTPIELVAHLDAVLMKTRDKAAEDALKQWWNDEKRVEGMILAVPKARKQDALGKVRDFLKDQRPNVRRAAMSALGEWRDGESVERLLDLIEKDTDRAEAVRAAVRIGQAQVPEAKIAGVAERFVALAEKLTVGKDEAGDELIAAARVYATDPRIPADKLKQLVERLPKGKTAADKLIAEIPYPEVVAKVVDMGGDAEKGKLLFTQRTCILCHTVTPGDKPKGPFLGDVGDKYQRKELAESVLTPSAVIAQGFVTHLFKLTNGQVLLGFVTKEGSDEIEVRTIIGQVSTVKKSDIASDEPQAKSTMPEGLVNSLTVAEFSNLLEYLRSLKTK